MKRPLCVAIALALTLAAGCSTRESRQASSVKPPSETETVEVKEQLAAVADAAQLKDDRAATGNASVRAEAPMRLERERDEGRVDAAPASKQVAASAALVAQEAVAVTHMSLPPAAPPAPPAPGIVATPATPPPYSEPSHRENYAEIASNPI